MDYPGSTAVKKTCPFCSMPQERVRASNTDLSAAVLPGHPEAKAAEKYKAWAKALFETTGTESPKLREPVYFWTKAWRRSAVGIWGDFGPTRLTFLEYLLIGVASAVFPDTLLNREGRNRK